MRFKGLGFRVDGGCDYDCDSECAAASVVVDDGGDANPCYLQAQCLN